MIFTPYTDEGNVINMIHKYSNKPELFMLIQV